MKLNRDNTFSNQIVFVDGHCNSGKALISRLLEGYENVEKSKEDEIFYCIHKLWELGNMDINTAIVLLKTWNDRILNNQMIGREINFRLHDTTSVLKYPYPYEYILRGSSNDDHQLIVERINDKKPIFQNMISNALCNFNLFYEAFGRRVKFIYTLRNSEIIIHNMNKRGYGNRIGIDPTEMQFSFKFKNKSYPTYAYGWENEYDVISPLERIIYMTYNYQKSDFDMYRKLTNDKKKQVLFLEFDNFFLNQDKFCNDIGKFINREPTSYLYGIIHSRTPNIKENDLVNKIKKQCNKKYCDLLDKTIEEYNNFLKEYM